MPFSSAILAILVSLFLLQSPPTFADLVALFTHPVLLFVGVNTNALMLVLRTL
jgi:hypothetical protein